MMMINYNLNLTCFFFAFILKCMGFEYYMEEDSEVNRVFIVLNNKDIINKYNTFRAVQILWIIGLGS